MSLEFVSDVNNPMVYGIEIIQNATDDDTLDGGDGTDTASYADAVDKVEVDLGAGTAKQYDAAGAVTATDSLANVENVIGSAAADSLVGDTENNVLTGFTGDDTIDGGGGFDTADYAKRTTAINALISSAEADGTFTVSLFDGDDVSTIVETDTLTAVEMVTGTALNDSIAGSADANSHRGRRRQRLPDRQWRCRHARRRRRQRHPDRWCQPDPLPRQQRRRTASSRPTTAVSTGRWTTQTERSPLPFQ